MAEVLHNHINFVDKRQHSRHACDMRGKIKFGTTKISDCIVKDISIGGALLMFPVGSWVPNNFDLELPNGFPAIHATTVWQDNDRVGIKFERQSQ